MNFQIAKNNILFSVYLLLLIGGGTGSVLSQENGNAKSLEENSGEDYSKGYWIAPTITIRDYDKLGTRYRLGKKKAIKNNHGDDLSAKIKNLRKLNPSEVPWADYDEYTINLGETRFYVCVLSNKRHVSIFDISEITTKNGLEKNDYFIPYEKDTDEVVWYSHRGLAKSILGSIKQ